MYIKLINFSYMITEGGPLHDKYYSWHVTCYYNKSTLNLPLSHRNLLWLFSQLQADETYRLTNDTV